MKVEYRKLAICFLDENENVTVKKKLTTNWDITIEEVLATIPKPPLKEEIAQFLLAAFKQDIELSDICELLEKEYQDANLSQQS